MKFRRERERETIGFLYLKKVFYLNSSVLKTLKKQKKSYALNKYLLN